MVISDDAWPNRSLWAEKRAARIPSFDACTLELQLGRPPCEVSKSGGRLESAGSQKKRQLTLASRRRHSQPMPAWFDHIRLFLRPRQRFTDPVSFLASLADSLDNAIIGLSKDGTVVLWNAAVQQLSGRAAADVLGSNVTSIVPREGRAEVADLVEQVIRRRLGTIWSGNLVRKVGDPVPVTAAVRAVRDESGAVRGAVIVIHNGLDAIAPQRGPSVGC